MNEPVPNLRLLTPNCSISKCQLEICRPAGNIGRGHLVELSAPPNDNVADCPCYVFLYLFVDCPTQLIFCVLSTIIQLTSAVTTGGLSTCRKYWSTRALGEVASPSQLCLPFKLTNLVLLGASLPQVDPNSWICSRRQFNLLLTPNYSID